MSLGAVISAGANLLGGLFGNSQAKRQEELQKEFAQTGIQWRVEDAKKAGIHPLAALGAQTHSYAPTMVGGGLSEGIASAGQDIGRAIDATRGPAARATAFTKTVQDLTLTKMGLENEILASQLAKYRVAGHPPARPDGTPMVIDGQGNSFKTLGGQFGLVADPRNTPASKWEDQYGEAGDWVGGVGNMASDAGREFFKWASKDPLGFGNALSRAGIPEKATVGDLLNWLRSGKRPVTPAEFNRRFGDR